MRPSSIWAPLAGVASVANAITLDLTSKDSIKSVTSTLAYDMMTFYTGNQSGGTPGLLPGPCAAATCYYWWEAGAMFGALINYWQYTGDSSYNTAIGQALAFQVGPDYNYNPPNQSKDMGIDDQAFWAFTAMDAAEANFPEAGGDTPSWLALAQGVYNFQAAYWDGATCGGGMRWQVYPFNAGYNLKNTISNGGNFQLAARLARYTGNSTYADWADKMWDWIAQSQLFQTQNGDLYIWDNTDTDNNCTDVAHYVWTYNYGTMLMGAAYMYAYTNGSSVWEGRVNQILTGAYPLFFPSTYGSNTMTEMECEIPSNCDSDQSSFKAYLSRWMAVTSILVPSTAAQIQPKLQASANGAAGQCNGGTNGRMCGRRWYTTTWDGTTGVGQQMCAMSVIGANLIDSSMAPLSIATGGNSTSNPSAGTTTQSGPPGSTTVTTTKDRAGAGILTVLVIVAVIGASIWIIM